VVDEDFGVEFVGDEEISVVLVEACRLRNSYWDTFAIKTALVRGWRGGDCLEGVL
jgi:hypothetical protein